jgi:hypothetical protein
MAKDLTISVLYDFYGELLTQKQREVIELYYNEDLSLAEIAADSGITRQGVRDSIKRGECQLLEFERQLGLAGRFSKIEEKLEEICRSVSEIEQINNRLCGSREISSQAAKITELARAISELE